MFNGFIENYKASNFRKKNLDTLINNNFKKHNTVYLIRTPINKEKLDVENIFYSDDFDGSKSINTLSKLNNILYFNFNKSRNDNYATYYEHHIGEFSGKPFTKAVCGLIIKSL